MKTNLQDWVLMQRERELQVSVLRIKLQAHISAREMSIEGFVTCCPMG